jgi:hypothetical protein
MQVQSLWVMTRLSSLVSTSGGQLFDFADNLCFQLLLRKSELNNLQFQVFENFQKNLRVPGMELGGCSIWFFVLFFDFL